LQFTYSNKSH